MPALLRYMVLSLVCLLIASGHLVHAQQDYLTYDGSVGKAKATFKLRVVSSSWGTQKIEGLYYLNSKPAKKYELHGTLRKKDLQVDEYTPGPRDSFLTAKLYLTGDLAGGFVGKMYNQNDSRQFNVVLFGLL